MIRDNSSKGLTVSTGKGYVKKVGNLIVGRGNDSPLSALKYIETQNSQIVGKIKHPEDYNLPEEVDLAE